VFSHKPCWTSAASPSGYATDGGFAFQMRALSELFEATTVVVPVSPRPQADGECSITGRNLKVVPLTELRGKGAVRKLGFPLWLARNGWRFLRELRAAEAIHAPVPGDVGTAGMLLGFLLRKRLFVRHCGNWFVQTTAAERFWKWFIERCAGGRNVMLATGGSDELPSGRNPAVRWIFSTSLTSGELAAYGAPRRRMNDSSPQLIIACRQSRLKGTGRLIESMPLILQSLPGARLEVAGDGPDLNAFRALAAQLGLSGRVIFRGKLSHDEVMEALREADLFCYPTASSEGFPKAVLEAMACGLPIVTTRVSVLPQLLKSGCGVLLPDTSPPSIACAVAECFADAGRYLEMSARSVESARQYSLEQWRNKIGERLREAWGTLAG
jgi:glycosyltransferase involved in cell wall biosynthesis